LIGMPIFRWGHSWNTFRDLEREVDRLLQGVTLAFPGVRLGQPYPAMNLYERQHEYLLTAELPGVRREDLDLTITGGMLTIQGRRDDSPKIPEEKFRRSERFRGSWKRTIPVPDRVKHEELTAEFNNGILKIHLPKAEEVLPRQIPVVEGND
jgi:HSP20 family protein